jgi:myo-inositol-1(or 4)-monophosphatase
VPAVSEAELLAVAADAARAAGALLLERFGGRQLAAATKSTPTDPVGEADLAAERAIGQLLAARRPDDAVLGEEGGAAAGTSGLRWVVDPLDGTVNYLYGIDQWAVSVACEDPEGAVAGVVLDPIRDELWAATRSGPATVNDVPIHCSEPATLAETLVATGFGYAPDVRAAQGQSVARLLPLVRDIRRPGAAALDLCWTAAGRHDAYFERGVKRWDVAAGRLVCARAGLTVRTLAPAPPQEAGVLVAPPSVVDALAALVD